MPLNRLEPVGPSPSVMDSDSLGGSAAETPGAAAFAALLAMLMVPPAASQTVAQPAPQERSGAGTDPLPLSVPITLPQRWATGPGVIPEPVVPEATTPQLTVPVLSPVLPETSLQSSIFQTQRPMTVPQTPGKVEAPSQMNQGSAAPVAPSPIDQVSAAPGAPWPVDQPPTAPVAPPQLDQPLVVPVIPSLIPQPSTTPGAPASDPAQPLFAPPPRQRPGDRGPVPLTDDLAPSARPMAPVRPAGPRAVPPPVATGRGSATELSGPALYSADLNPRPLSFPIQTTAPDGSLPLPSTVAPDQLMELLARALVTTKPGRYSVTLHLTPENLGDVRLQIHITGKEVQAVIQTATSEARQALQSSGEELRRGLDQAGLNLSGFDVSTGGGGGTQDRERQFQEALQRLDRRRGRPASATASATPDRMSLLGVTRRSAGGFDTIA